jgi:hypothetical protein
MRVSLVRAELEFAVSFARPAFELATGATGLVESMAKSLSSKYALSSEDVRFVTGNTLADVEVKVNLFNRNGLIRLNAERLHMKFQSIATPTDMEVVTSSIELSLIGASSLLNAVPLQQEILNAHLHLRALDGANAIEAFFAPYRVGAVGKAQLVGVKLAKVDRAARESFSFDAAPSWHDENSILVSVAQFSQADLGQDVRTKIDLVRQRVRETTESIGLVNVLPEGAK